MTATTILITAIVILAVSLVTHMLYTHAKLREVQEKLDDMCLSSYNSLGIAMTVMLNKQVDEIRAMKNEVQHLIETEQYEKAMKLKPKIIEREKMVEEAAQAFNRHSAGMRIALDGETEE